MIDKIRHRGLRRMHARNDASYLPPQHRDKIKDMLGLLSIAASPAEVDVPGWNLHQLKGDLAGFWAISVSRNWRIIFRFDGANVTDVDLVDYH